MVQLANEEKRKKSVRGEMDRGRLLTFIVWTVSQESEIGKVVDESKIPGVGGGDFLEKKGVSLFVVVVVVVV